MEKRKQMKLISPEDMKTPPPNFCLHPMCGDTGQELCALCSLRCNHIGRWRRQEQGREAIPEGLFTLLPRKGMAIVQEAEVPAATSWEDPGPALRPVGTMSPPLIL